MRVPGGSGFDAVELEGAAQSAQFFTSVLPDIASLPWAYSLSSRTDTQWSWTPSGSGSMLISYDFYNSSGAYLNSSICHGSDTGFMTVPGSAVTASSRSYVSISLMRLISGSSSLPQGRGDIFYTGAAVVTGTGVVQ